MEDAEETRPLSRVEHDLLDALLRHDFSGVEPLREQARAVSARRGCGCGCGTIELVVDPDAGAVPLSTASGPVPVGGEVLDAGTVVGGVLLFVDDGLLSSLEVYSVGDDPLPLPTPDRVAWFRHRS